jgi:hypothetical protein
VLLLSPIHFFSCSAVTAFSRCCYPFPGSAQADLVLSADAVSTARLRIPYFHRVFFLSPPSFPGRRRPTLCPSQPRFQPPLTTNHQLLAAHLTASMIRFDSFFLIRFTGFQNSICPKHLLCFSFHQHFPSCFFYDLHLPWVGAGRPCAFRNRGFNRRTSFPCGFLFTTPIFPGSAQADLVPFAAAVSTARLRIPYFPYGFLLTSSIFPGSTQADLVFFAAAVSTAAHHQPLTAWMIRFD